MLSDIHTIRIYCEKHDYLIGMIPIVKLHRGKKVKSSGRQNKLWWWKINHKMFWGYRYGGW